MSINPTFWATTASPSAALCLRRASLFGFNLNSEEETVAPPPPAEEGGATNTMPLFEKPLTPSDVGKLNRLVIPKQHAEKYFPLNGGGGGGDTGEKGLLLGFEDEAGKPWRFRYSYWNSSQSYVLTKGWSRFVKEKRLDAGDIVLFARHPKEAGRLFIGWRRRSAGGGQDGGAYSGQPNTISYQTHSHHAENHIRARNKNSKRLRLFGVNLECDEDESEPSTTKAFATSSSHQHPYHDYYTSYSRTDYTEMKVWEGDVHDDEDAQG